MRVYKYRRETLEGSFSLTNIELRVGQISDPKGNLFKGISIYGGLHGPLIGADRAIVLDESSAKSLLDFIDRIQRQEIPTLYSVSMNRFEKFRWDVSKFLPNWHERGGLSGRISVRSILGFRATPATISVDATQKLKECIAGFYEI